MKNPNFLFNFNKYYLGIYNFMQFFKNVWQIIRFDK